MMLHDIYESSSLTVRDKKSFFFPLPWQNKFFMEFKSLKYSESASPKDHFCEVSLKSDWQFQRIFLVIVYGRMTDIV